MQQRIDTYPVYKYHKQKKNYQRETNVTNVRL